MKVLGIDEAGRGCVVGPMVVGGVVIDEADSEALFGLGVRDSKKLSPKKRGQLVPKILGIAVASELRLVEPGQIDETSLNLLDLDEIASLILKFSPQKVFFDVPTHPSGISNFVKSVRASLGGKTRAKGWGIGAGELAEVTLIGENRADEKFPVVSAASILAKVERDRIVSELREEYGDLGSGYMSDSKTQDFLRVWFEKFGDFPPIVRRKWSSVQKFLVKQQDLGFNSMAKLIIGVTGSIGSGKNTIAEHLKEKGFSYCSLSDLLREEAQARGNTNFTRKDLQDLGDELRIRFGPSILAKRALEKASKDGAEKIVLNSIKNPAELSYLREQPNFYLLGLVVSQKVRFKRKLASGRSDDGDIKSWEEFLRKDKREMESDQKALGQQADFCLKHADFIIENTGTIEELFGEVEKILEALDGSRNET